MICDTSIPVKLVRTIILDYLERNDGQVELLNCESTVIAKGSGFTSKVIRCTLTWNTEANNHLPTSVIVKAPLVSCFSDLTKEMFGPDAVETPENREACLEIMKKMHCSECGAYKILGSVMPSPIPIPIVYGMNVDEEPRFIVMQDFADQGCLDTVFPGSTLPRWQAVGDFLADLHAWSIKTTIPWRDHVQSFEFFWKENTFFTEKLTKTLKKVKVEYVEHFEHVDEKLYDQVMKVDFYKKHAELMPVVMLHGDTWCNNIIFAKDEQGKICDDHILAFIDWQLCLSGCGLWDLARFTSICVPYELRMQHEKDVVKRYMDRFCRKSGRPVEFEKAWKTYEEMMAFNSLMFLTLANFVTKFFVDDKITGDEREKMKAQGLDRLKKGYDEAVKFFQKFPPA